MLTAEMIKSMLLSDIDSLVSQPDKFARDPKRDFSRVRKFSPSDVLLFQILMERDTMNMELLKYFEYDKNAPSMSAYYQQRRKLLPDTYRYLLNSFNSHFQPSLLKDRFVPIAVDGSGFNLFRDPKEVTFIKPNRTSPEGHNEIHVTAAYQIFDRIYTDAVIQPSPKKNEFLAMCELVDRCNISGGTPLFIADRGFSSYNVFAHCQEAGSKFLIRAKDLYIKRLLKHDMPAEENGEFDITVERIIYRTKRKAFLETLEKPEELYRYIDSNTRFDFIEPSAEDVYSMTLRVVRLEICDGVYENLITNLSPEEFSLSDLRELYHLRWSIENSYRELKHVIGAQDFHCRSFDYIIHEMLARLILYNFCSRVTALVVVKKRGKKYIHQVNYTMAMKNAHTFLRQKISDPPIDIISLIGKYTEPIRPGRNFPHNLRFQPPMKFNYRH